MPEGLSELELELKRDSRSRKFYDLAKEYQKAGRLADALRVCDAGVNNHPNFAQARILHAQLLLAGNNLAAARASILRALQVLPDHVVANHLAADILWALGETGQAVKHYQIVHLFDPGREGVAERIRALTEPDPVPQAPEVVPSREVEAILNPSIPVSSAGARPEILPREAGPQEPIRAEAGGADAEVSVPEEAGVPESQDVPKGISDGEVFSQVVSTPDPEVSPAAPEEDEAPSPAPVVEKEEIESPSLLGDGSIGEGLLDLGEESGWEIPDEEEQGAPAPLLLETIEIPPNLGATPVPVEEEPAEEVEKPSGWHSPDSLSTMTLASLYEQQGYPEKAVEVYQRLLIRNPDDTQVLGRIQAMKEQMERGAVEPDRVDQEEIRRALRQRSVRALNEWLRRVREERHVS